MRRMRTPRLLAGMFALVALGGVAQAITIDVEIDEEQMGLDGTDDDEGTTLEIDLTSTEVLGDIIIDLSAWGTGEGNGVDLSNITADDIEVVDQGGLALGLSVQGIVIDNDDKIITIDIQIVNVVLVVNIGITINDLQNPNCPGEGTVVVDSTGILGDPGEDELTFDGGHIDLDDDSLPDGFEIYYSGGEVRGDEDANPGFKNAGLDPDVDNDPLADTDGDGWSDIHEFRGCVNPQDDAALPDDSDTDADGIFDIDEDYPGEDVNTDGAGDGSDANDTDSDDDGLSDRDEAGEDYLNDPMIERPVDTDGDGAPDFQDPDSDNDGVPDGDDDDDDNCDLVFNPDQTDTDDDGIGDACDPDIDDDTILNDDDNCVFVPNTD